MIQLGTESKKFGFVVNQDNLSAVLSNIKNLAGGDGSFFISCADKELWIIATSSMFIGALKVAAEEVSGEGQFGFNVDLIQGITKGRAAVAFNFTGSECEFKALKSKYSGKIVTIPITKEQASNVNEAFSLKSKGIKLSSDVLIAISNGINSTGLINLVDKQKCNSMIEIAKGRISVSAFDEYHMMLYSNKVKCDEEIKFSINPQTMNIIQKAINGKFELSVKKESIKFSGKNFTIIVPTVQAEDDKYQVARSYIKTLGNQDTFTADVEINTLLNTCTNLDTIHTANSQFDLELQEKGLNVRFITEQGSAQDVIPTENGKGKGQCSLNPKAFMDMLMCTKAHGGKSIGISVFESVAFMKANKKGAKLEGVCVLSQTSAAASGDKKSKKKSDTGTTKTVKKSREMA